MFKTPGKLKWFLPLSLLLLLTACGAGTESSPVETKDKTAIEKIATYAQKGKSIPTLQDYKDAGVNGINAKNLVQINLLIKKLNYEAVDSKAEIQAIINNMGTEINDDVVCSQVITHAYNPKTQEEDDFATPCDVPKDWIIGSPADVDKVLPVINLIGVATVNLAVGDDYTDAGATANDNKDGDITNHIIINNPVNTGVADTYKITYNVDDAAHNHAIQVTRTVVVSEPLVARDYGNGGSSAIADPIVESVNGNSVIILPEGVNAANPVAVVFLAPGFQNTDYTKYQTILNFIASHGYAAIFAKDANGFSAKSILANLRDMVNNPAIKPLLDTSRIGVIGHSSGGGHAFRIMNEFSDVEGWGKNGRFILSLEPWFAMDMTEDDMKTLPANTNIVIQQYGKGGNNKENDTDARIPLTEYYLLDSIVDAQKDYQVFVGANHHYPYGKVDYSQMQGILKPLDGLMEFNFKDAPDAGAHQVALEVGNDDPYNEGHGIQEVKPIGDYHYKCHGANTIINYCGIYEGASLPDSEFSDVATNNSKSKPDAIGKSIIDQEFGKEVMRFTNRTNQNDTPLVNDKGERISRGNAHPYPKTQAWNSDMTMIRMRYRLYDAKTLKELPITSGTNSLHELYHPINGALSEMKWSSVHPNVFYGVWNSQFWKGTVDRVKNTIHFDKNPLHDFAPAVGSYDKFTIGKYEGNIDFSDEYVVFAARKQGEKYLTAIVYNIKSNTVEKIKDFPEAQWPDEGQVFDWVSVSPLGGHILMSSGGKVDQYDLDLNFVRHLANNAGHGDLGVDQKGGEVYVQYEYGVDRGIWMYRLADGGRFQLLPDKYNGGHLSCRNFNRKGWCYASTNAENHREVLAVKLDDSGAAKHIVNRFAQTHTSGHSSMVNVSPDGKRLLFKSDWGDEGMHWADWDTYLVK